MIRSIDLAHTCPACGTQMDSLAARDGAGPSPGDITICIRCAAIAVFTDTLAVRLPTADEKADYMTNPNVHQVVNAVLNAIERDRGQR